MRSPLTYYIFQHCATSSVFFRLYIYKCVYMLNRYVYYSSPTNKKEGGKMITWVQLAIDVTDLEIDYDITRDSDVSEFWGRKETIENTYVDINSVKYKGVEVDDFDHSALEDYILNVLEK